MARDRSRTPDDGTGAPSKRERRVASDSETDSRSDSDDGSRRRHRKSERKRKRKSREDEEDSYTSSSSYSDDCSDSYSESGSDSESGISEEEEEHRRRRKRKERRKKVEEERRRRKEKEKRKRRQRKEKEEKEERKRKKKKKKDKEKKNKDKIKIGAVTNSWGKYGIIRETDMWNKRPEFTAWLLEVKKVNLESLPNWEEKQMFKEFMEDHNTATFPSKKYYDLDAYHRREMEKEAKRGTKSVKVIERTVFDDEEQRRQEMLQVRERQKQAEVEALKRAMQSGLAQEMKEQARLKEEMAYQYKIGNFEAAAAIQRRLDPDAAM